MDISFSPKDKDFRQQVRDFLSASLPAPVRLASALSPGTYVHREIMLEWQGILHKKGWLAYNWPVEHGGSGWSAIQRFIFERECALAGAPELIPLGLRYAGPLIFTFGSAWQKAFFLPRILSGEHYWAQGFSEPGAGSDLAALQCRAAPAGEHYMVNGSKIWTTHAHFANWIFCLVRTSKEEKRQQGISLLLIDMTAPGVSVKPIITIDGEHDVNQVFFDEVKVPAAQLVGEEGKGWDYAKFLLEFERGGACFSGRLRHAIEELKKALQRGELRRGPVARHRLAMLEMRLLALEMTELRIVSAATEPFGAAASVIKLLASELQQDISRLAVEWLGHAALPFEFARPLYGPDAPQALVSPFAQPLMSHYLNLRAASIYGGSSEIQKEIIARQALGLC